jgi:NADH-quinone oxidoreductase subunit E
MDVQENTAPSAEELKALEDIYTEFAPKNSLMIFLQQIQAKFNYLPPFAIEYISEKTNISESHIYGVITFYAQFSLKPVGKNIIKVCNGTACHVGGSKVLGKKLRSYLKLSDEEETTEDFVFTVQNVACLGCCALAPAVMVNGKVYGKMDVDRVKEVVETYRKATDIE